MKMSEKTLELPMLAAGLALLSLCAAFVDCSPSRSFDLISSSDLSKSKLSSSFRSSALDQIRIAPSSHFVDSSGRVRIFHGFNHVAKSFPWVDLEVQNSTLLQLYQQMGLNVIRLGIIWNGVNPVDANYFNDSYLDLVGSIVDSLAEFGVYSLIDNHQDVGSSEWGLYDAFPKWAVDLNTPDHAYPWPFAPDSPALDQWAIHYFTEACASFFQALYDNKFGLADSFAAFWRYTVDKLKVHASILGYELINEPFAGDLYKNPLILLPGEAGSKNLQHFYDEISAAVRQADENALIFFEPVTWAYQLENILSANISGTGFSHVPGGSDFQDRSVLSYHYYCWFINGFNMSADYPQIDRVLCDDLLGPSTFDTVRKDSQIFGGGRMLTEFGLCEPDAEANSTNTIECDFVLDEADKNLQSWTYWDGWQVDLRSAAGESGKSASPHLSPQVIRSFARAYPMATAGTPTKLSFDVFSGDFYYEYVFDPAISAPTEIFLPIVFHYSNGFFMNVTSVVDVEVSADNPQVLLLQVKEGGAQPQTIIFQVQAKFGH